MTNDMGKMILAIGSFIGFVLLIAFSALVLNQISKSSIGNENTQKMADQYSFIARLFIDWAAPDPALWAVRIFAVVIIAVIGGGVLFYRYRG